MTVAQETSFTVGLLFADRIANAAISLTTTECERLGHYTLLFEAVTGYRMPVPEILGRIPSDTPLCSVKSAIFRVARQAIVDEAYCGVPVQYDDTQVAALFDAFAWNPCHPRHQIRAALYAALEPLVTVGEL